MFHPLLPSFRNDVEERQKMWSGGRARRDGWPQGNFFFVSDTAGQQNIWSSVVSTKRRRPVAGQVSPNPRIKSGFVHRIPTIAQKLPTIIWLPKEGGLFISWKVAFGKLTMFQVKATFPNIYGQHKLDSIYFNKNLRLKVGLLAEEQWITD